MSKRLNIYNNRDNASDVQTLYNDQPADLSTVTKMSATVGDVTVDSDTLIQAFDWSAGNGMATLMLGFAEFPIGLGTLRLIAYSPDWPHGVVLGDLEVRVI
jgi:hypothetical protein